MWWDWFWVPSGPDIGDGLGCLISVGFFVFLAIAAIAAVCYLWPVLLVAVLIATTGGLIISSCSSTVEWPFLWGIMCGLGFALGSYFFVIAPHDFGGATADMYCCYGGAAIGSFLIGKLAWSITDG